mmetsp:Transcript_20966/g.31973  ORF Transcript_20966/g.31973 Transcript_20966/m.31973 type:complete len:574 (+) Transcript_20966:96-1817(+)
MMCSVEKLNEVPQKIHPSPMNAFATKNCLPREFLSHLSKEMGLSVSEVENEAESIWSMLTELQESNPDAYRDFVKKQIEEGACSDKAKPGRFFTPQKGFVVQLKLKGRDGEYLYVNFCMHDAMAKPSDPSGKPVTNSSDLQNLQVPLAVSKNIRTIKNDGEENNLVVDIVFHPWCLEKAESSQWFKKEMVDLAVTWFQREHAKIAVEKGWVLLKSSYYGGEGPKFNEVARFYVPDNLMNGRDCEPGDKKKHVRESKNATPKKSFKLTSTESLISLLNENEENESESKENADSVSRLVLPEENSKTSKTKDAPPLIEEIVKGTSGKSNKYGKNRNNRDSRKVLTIRKGFLNGSKKRAPLYESGSSGAGTGEGGSYAKLLSKCNVIDTSSAIKHDVHNGKKDCANGSFESAAGQLHGQIHKRKEAGTFDAEFERICKLVDPDVNHKDVEAETMELLSKLDCAMEQNVDSGIDKSIAVKPAEQKVGTLDNIPISIKTMENADILKIDLSEQSNISNINDIDLRVSGADLVITSPTCPGRLYTTLSKYVDAKQIAARFNKNRGILTVRINYCEDSCL